jgi:hypothetical protein
VFVDLEVHGLQGVPIRLELGSKDMGGQAAVLACRDTGVKETLLEDFTKYLAETPTCVLSACMGLRCSLSNNRFLIDFGTCQGCLLMWRSTGCRACPSALSWGRKTWRARCGTGSPRHGRQGDPVRGFNLTSG